MKFINNIKEYVRSLNSKISGRLIMSNRNKKPKKNMKPEKQQKRRLPEHHSSGKRAEGWIQTQHICPLRLEKPTTTHNPTTHHAAATHQPTHCHRTRNHCATSQITPQPRSTHTTNQKLRRAKRHQKLNPNAVHGVTKQPLPIGKIESNTHCNRNNQIL